MRTLKIAVTIDQDLLARLDRLVEEERFPSRSRAVQEAIRDKLDRIDRSRLARECAKLDPRFEQALAEEGFAADLHEWPEQHSTLLDIAVSAFRRAGHESDANELEELQRKVEAGYQEQTNVRSQY